MENNTTNKENNKHIYKNHLIDKSSVWGLPVIYSILFFLFIFLINYSPSSAGPAAAAVAQNTPFFHMYKVLLSTGIPLTLLGLILNSSSIFPIDVYSKSNSSYLFKNHWHTIFFKIIIMVIGLILCFLSYIFEPESKTPFTFSDYVLIFIGLFFIIGILLQILSSIKSLIQNKEDYIFINDDRMEWFDDKNQSVHEIKLSEIKTCEKLLEETEKYPDIIGLSFTTSMGNQLKIDFESMSLIPQSKFIFELISQKISKKTIHEKI
jgi:hypothetical protein